MSRWMAPFVKWSGQHSCGIVIRGMGFVYMGEHVIFVIGKFDLIGGIGNFHLKQLNIVKHRTWTADSPKITTFNIQFIHFRWIVHRQLKIFDQINNFREKNSSDFLIVKRVTVCMERGRFLHRFLSILVPSTFLSPNMERHLCSHLCVRLKWLKKSPSRSP